MPLLRRSPEELLPLLVSTYLRGHLVPFLGAGMSYPNLVLWDEFVTNLEQAAGVKHDGKYSSNLDVRAQNACTMIRYSRGAECFLDAIGKALWARGKPHEMPPQTAALAEIHWPLVVSTNYDDLYLAACLNSACGRPPETPPIPLGRSPKDCKLIMSSLHGPLDQRFVWHVQGFLGGQYLADIEKRVPSLGELRQQLVVGHAEYRVVTNAQPHFRRCFLELFKSRSFLFLGSGLTETYFLNLFEEALELLGPSEVPHFAVAQKGAVDAHFLADQMNITVCEFDNLACDLPVWLAQLRDSIDGPRRVRNTEWSFAVGAGVGADELKIVREDAPVRPGPREVVALVAGRDKHKQQPILTGAYKELDGESQRAIGNHIVRYDDSGVYAVTARCKGNEDDGAVDEAVIEFLDEIAREHRTGNLERVTVHLQLSPAGGTVPPVFAFIRAVSAFGAWTRKRDTDPPRNPFRLIVHIQSQVEFNLMAGRIDIHELLSSDLIRFWSVVLLEPEKEPVRRILHYKDSTLLRDVLEDLGIPSDSEKAADWRLSVCPSPRKEPPEGPSWPLFENASPTLLSLGIGFGSVVTLKCTAGHCPANQPSTLHSGTLLDQESRVSAMGSGAVR